MVVGLACAQRAKRNQAEKGCGGGKTCARVHALFLILTRRLREALRPLPQAVPTSTAVEQWYSMLVVPKHQITSLLSWGT